MAQEEGVLLKVEEGEREEVPLLHTVRVGEREMVWVGEVEMEKVPLGEVVGEKVEVGHMVEVPQMVEDTVNDGEAEGDPECVTEAVPQELREGLRVMVGDTLPHALTVWVAVMVGDMVEHWEGDLERVTEALREGDRVEHPDTEGVSDSVEVGHRVTVAL